MATPQTQKQSNMKTKRNLMLAMAAALLPFAGSGASAGLIGTTGLLPTGITRTSGYYAGNGGEFTIGGSGLDLTSYAASTKTTNSFQTFCLEGDEYTFSNKGSYFVNDKALAGGWNTNGGDPISKGTAWLYSQFASGTWETGFGLPTYNYAVGTGRSVSAGLLQNAIWYLEDEGVGGIGSYNAFVTAAENKFGDLATAKLGSAPGEFGVGVLNTFNTQTVGTGYAQDQLYYNPAGFNVPDGGASVILLGIALGGLSLARRYAKT